MILASIIPGFDDQTLFMLVGAAVVYFIYHGLFKHDVSVSGLMDFITKAKEKKAEDENVNMLIESLSEHPEYGPKLIGRLRGRLQHHEPDAPQPPRPKI
jgi:hypothetical protein